MDKTAVIFCGGEYIEEKRLEFLKSSFTVCADSGYNNAVRAGFTPNVVIGDFDSINGNVDTAAEVLKFPVHKDETDSQLCVDYLIEKGFKKAYMTCAMGGRIDHSMANTALIAYGIKRGMDITVIGDDYYMFGIVGEKEIYGNKGEVFSVFPFGGDCEGVSEKGFEYELSDADLYADVPMGISNTLKEPVAKITVKKGILIAVHYR